MTEFDYWQTKYAEAQRDLDAADVRFVMSFGAKLSRDGNQFCVLIGESLQEGFATFDSSPLGAIHKMQFFLIKGLNLGV